MGWGKLDVIAVLGTAALAACGGGAGGSGSDAGGGGGGADAQASTAIEFLTSPHTLAAGSEDYRCTWFAAPAVSGAAIHALHPVVSGPGVHHIALFFAPGGTVEPERACPDFGGNWVLVGGAGVGSDDVSFPDGVALPLRTDGVYIVQVHMLNSGPAAVAVQAGYDLVPTPAGQSFTRAGIYVTGTTRFTVPAGAIGYSAGADCSGDLPPAATLVSLFPHMHKRGVHFHVDHVVGSQTATLFDGSWLFDAQQVVPFQPGVALAPTDHLVVRCTWDNQGGQPVSYGLSTSDEMCFGVFYYYPATADQIDCVK